jgi:hypothetical protein
MYPDPESGPESDPSLDADPDADPDPAIFVIDLRGANKNQKFFCLLLFEGTFTSFFKR